MESTMIQIVKDFWSFAITREGVEMIARDIDDDNGVMLVCGNSL
jgi:hypothetical protein